MENELSEFYQFDCGCKFRVIGKSPLPYGKLPLLRVNADLSTNDHDINFECKKTWEMLGEGLSCGLFQVETSLGKTFLKKLKPENIEHLSGLGAILRPAALKNVDNEGISTTSHYCRRKNNEEPVEYKYECLREILEPTYGELIFQEQSLEIAKKVAGFDLKEADSLRKCVPGHTLFVSKQRGWISIDELLKTHYNDDFLTMDEMGRQQWKKISSIWSTGKHNVLELNTENNLSICLTKYHQILTHRGWKARMRVKEDDFMICANNVDFDGKDVIPKNLSMVIAGLITEGYFTEKGCHFVNHDEGMMKTFVDNFVSYFGFAPQISEKVPTVANIHKSEKEHIHKYLSYGKSEFKFIPSQMMGSTKETCRDFLSFMLAAEGSVTKNTGVFDFSSKSLKLIKQVQLLLLRFGIQSYFNSREASYKKDGVKVDCGIAYRLNVGGAHNQLKLLKELSYFWPEYKKNDLKESLERRIDYKGFTSDVFPNEIVTKMLDQYPQCIGYEGSGTLYNKDISRQRFQRFCQKTEDVNWINLSRGNQYYRKFKNFSDFCNKYKHIETYDFSMEDESCPFIVANGLVIHNSIGKKIPEEMSKMKKLFIEKSEQVGIVTKEEAEEIFGWIEKSQRYQFNRAHSVGYAIIGYITAYLKCHFPLQFFTKWLHFSQNKADTSEEVAALISDAKVFDIEVLPPDLLQKKKHFHTDGQSIYFGLTDIKGMGQSQYSKLMAELDKWQDLKGMTWQDFLFYVSSQISSATVERLIRVGALRKLSDNREAMFYEYQKWSELTDKEKDWLIKHRDMYGTLAEGLRLGAYTKKEGGACHNSKRVDILKSLAELLDNPPIKLIDTIDSVIHYEEEYLGLPITRHWADLMTASITHKCKDIVKGYKGYVVLGVKIDRVGLFKTKKGKNPGQTMAFLTFSDSTSVLDSVIAFPPQYEEFKDLLVKDNYVYVSGKLGEQGSFQVERVYPYA